MPSELTTVETRQRLPAAWIHPQSYAEAKALAQDLSESDMVPKDYRGKPANILVAIQFGAEVGLGPLSALQNVANINGRPSLWGDGLLAVCQSHAAWGGMKEWFEGTAGQDDFTAKCTVVRIVRGEPQEYHGSFSVLQAKRADLWGKDLYQKYPRRMLQMRARSPALRDGFADATRGMASAEEMYYAEPDKPVTAKVIDSQPLNGGVAKLKDKLGVPVEAPPAPEPAPTEPVPVVPPNRPPPDESEANPLDLTPPAPKEEPKRKAKKAEQPVDSKGAAAMCLDYATSAGIRYEEVLNEAQNITGKSVPDSRSLEDLAVDDLRLLFKSLQSLANAR